MIDTLKTFWNKVFWPEPVRVKHAAFVLVLYWTGLTIVEIIKALWQ